MARQAKPLDIYVRVSKLNGRGGDSFISPDLQEERCRAMATARGFGVGEVISDLDKSGGTMDRAGLKRAIARIRSGESGGIIVARIDRFARTLRGALDAIEEIQHEGGVLIECEGEWDTSTPMGRFGRDLVLRMAQLYREQVTDQWMDARRAANERGIAGKGNVPFGYVVGTDRRLVPVPEEAKVLRKAYAMRGQAASWAEIATYLDSTGLEPRQGYSQKRAVEGRRRWIPKSVGDLLRNPVYMGHAVYGDLVNEQAHEPVVTRGEWLAAQKHGTPGRLSRSPEGTRLAGLIHCASCGGRMTPSVGQDSYRCLQRRTNGPDCSAPAFVRMHAIDAFVVGKFVEHYRNKVGVMDDQQPDGGDAGIADLRRALAHATDALQALVDDPQSLAALPSGKRAELLTNASEAVDARQRDLDEALARRETSVSAVYNWWELQDLFDSGDPLHEGTFRGHKSLDSGSVYALSIAGQRRLLTSGIERVLVRKVPRGGPKADIEARTEIVWRDGNLAL
jgi:DNA invertase Pin-like site-specific DNA recombinase